MRAMCWSVPVSLLTCISETSPVSGRIDASSCSGSTTPDSSVVEACHVESSALEPRDRLEHGLVLKRGGDDVPATVALERVG